MSSSQKQTRQATLSTPACYILELQSNLLQSLISHSNSSEKSTMSKTVSEYQTRVYTLLQQIPEGRITSYAAIARALGSSPRAVGGALRSNPFAPEIPCHRCIASSGVRRGSQR